MKSHHISGCRSQHHYFVMFCVPKLQPFSYVLLIFKASEKVMVRWLMQIPTAHIASLRYTCECCFFFRVETLSVDKLTTLYKMKWWWNVPKGYLVSALTLCSLSIVLWCAECCLGLSPAFKKWLCRILMGNVIEVYSPFNLDTFVGPPVKLFDQCRPYKK